MIITNKNRLAYRILKLSNCESLYGLLHDEFGYWITNFQSHKWNKIDKSTFHSELLKHKKDKNVTVIQDPTVIRF